MTSSNSEAKTGPRLEPATNDAAAPGSAQPATSTRRRLALPRLALPRLARPRLARPRLAVRRWRGPGLRWLVVYGLVLILGLAGLLWAGVSGVRAGLAQRAAAQATAVADHYGRALAHMTAGENALALAELEMTLRLQPDHVEARAAMLRLMAATSTPQATSPPAPTPTPPPVTTPYTLDVLLSEAQALYDQAQWAQAAERLERMRAADASFQTEAVSSLLYKIYYNAGTEAVTVGRLEEGIRQFERALAVRPQDQAVQEQKELAVAYLQALSYWQANWQQAVKLFAELYKRRPNYLDVETRLANAAIAYGDALAQRNAWCDALAQYTIALQVRPSASLRATRDAASAICNDQAAATTSPTAGATAPPVAAPAEALASGYIYFSTWDTESNRFVLYRTVVAPGARPFAILKDARQPRSAPDGQRIAVRNVSGNQIGLATVNLQGDIMRRVTTFAEDEYAAWSPDAREWVFASTREGDRRWRLYHAWAEGTEATEFIIFGRSPAWYPGPNIAYEGCDDQGNRCGLWQITPDRAQREPLTDVAGDTAPAWAPGGNRLAFMSAQRSGNWDIFVREGNSGKVTAVAPGPNVEGLPTWSPDGQWLAFISNRDGAWGLYVVRPGGAPAKLFDLPGDLPDWMAEQIAWGP